MRYCFLRFPGGKPKAFTMSYDDGVRQDIRLAEICNKYGVKCTFNINAGLIAQEPGHRRLCADEIREHLQGAGHEIAVHGFNHQAPGAARPINTMQEVLKDRLDLEKEFGGIIRGMAYPDSGITKIHSGTSYETIRQILKDLGIVYSRSLSGDNDHFLLPEDWYNWVPTAHHNNPQVLEFAEKFVAFDYEKLYSSSRHPRLFYLWGHSYEFDNNDNWNRIEAILDILAGKDDTWYPTNIQLWEYVHAYESLVYSADGMRVYNPTLTEVWFNADGTDYSVKPGEMITMG